MNLKARIDELLDCSEQHSYFDTGEAVELLVAARDALPDASRFSAGDRIEVLGEPGGRTLHGRYLRRARGGHMVALDHPFVGEWAVHDDNIIYEEDE